MAVGNPQGNDKHLSKIMSFIYHMELKTFIEASYTNIIHTGENLS